MLLLANELLKNDDVEVENDVHELAVATDHPHRLLLDELFIRVTRLRPLAPQKSVYLRVQILTQLVYYGYFLVAHHYTLCKLLSHLHGTVTS